MKIENVAVISLEDYAEYLELKKEKQLKSIDYDRLKAGSVVKLQYSGSFCGSDYEFDFNSPFFIVMIDDSCGIASDFEFVKDGYSKPYITFMQNKHFLLASCRENMDYITEVIEY